MYSIFKEPKKPIKDVQTYVEARDADLSEGVEQYLIITGIQSTVIYLPGQGVC